MKAMILAAGYGTRLGELTKDVPKPMLDLGGQPILERIIRKLARQGFNQIGVNLHYKADMITDYFGNGSRFGVDLTYSYEPKLLGTAGGIKKMEWFLKTGTFLVHYGDIITNQDWGRMIRFHQKQNAIATLLIKRYRHAHSAIEVNADWRITTFLERPTTEERNQMESPWSWDNSCVHACSPKILEKIPANTVCDLARDIFPPLVSSKRLFAFPSSGYYCAIDSLEQLEEARKAC